MNMKKTIAAVAAGAVAVSAMATTVSALEAKTLTYNLVKATKNNDASGTITATFTNVPLQANGQLEVEAIGAGGGECIVTISGSYWDDAAGTNKSFVPVVATTRSWETGYSYEGSLLWNNGKVVVPVKDRNNVATQATNTALVSTERAVITVTVNYKNLPAGTNYAGALNSLISEGKRGIIISSIAAGQQDGANSTVTYTSNGKVATFNYLDTATQGKVNAAVGADGFNAEYVGAAGSGKWVKAGVAPEFTVSGITEAADPATGLVAADVKISALTKPATYSNEQCNNTFVLTFADGNWTDQYGNAWGGAITYDAKLAGTAAPAPGDIVTITGTKGVNQGTDAITAAGTVAGILNITGAPGDKLNAPGYAGGAAGTAIWTSPRSGAATEANGESKKERPYHSSLKNSIVKNYAFQGNYDGSGNALGADGWYEGSGNVISWIGWASDDNATWATYDHQAVSNAAMAVINDAVQNYGDVVFTFNTATKNVAIEKDVTGKIVDYYYTTDGTQDPKETWDGSKIYKSIVNYTAFGRHYWDRDTGYDANTIYINNDWLGNNLFEGALVINNNLTLSLGATDKFDWTSTSLSFSWDAIQDAALTQNQYANYIQTMILRTSTDWFWDNMTVTLGETETEEVDSGAPVEADDTDLPEEDAEEDLGDIDEEEEEAEPVEDVEPEPEPEPEPAPVETATNPGTGNASVALAVIPVALAAAAIVAKKRG